MRKTPLKRTGWKRKHSVSSPHKPRGAKNKPQSISTLKKKLWLVVAPRIKERDKYICYTSYQKVEGSNAHCGHGIASSICGGRLRYHPKNLHCQSYNENINAGGNGGEYYRHQVKDYGQKEVDKLYVLKEKYIKVDKIYYETLIELYTNGSWEDIENYLEN